MALTLFAPLAILGQQQVENGGFELWENAGTVIDEPTEWSSIKTSDNEIASTAAPVIWGRSEDAHSGNYSLKLFNTTAFTVIIVTGTMVSGRIHAEFNPETSYCYTDTLNPQWHTVLTQRPDSLVGWFRYYPRGNDVLQAKAILHVDEGKLPENGTQPNWIGLAAFQSDNATYDSWTRFSVPFEYFQEGNPEFILINLTSGNGTQAVDSSWALYDDIRLVYNPAGVGEPRLAQHFLHITGGRITIDLSDDREYLGCWFHVIDISGRSVFDEKLTGNLVSPLPESLPKGVYVALLHGKERTYAQKIYLE
jgi:hypothetical protein